jgi:hypothetical protein
LFRSRYRNFATEYFHIGLHHLGIFAPSPIAHDIYREIAVIAASPTKRNM